MPFLPVQSLAKTQVQAARRLVAHRLQFRIYVEALLAASPDDNANRRVLLGRSGGALSIDFSAATVRTLIGALDPTETAEAVTVDRRAELHIEPDQVEIVQKRYAGRITAIKQLKLYELSGPINSSADPRCRQLTGVDLPMVAAFYQRFYPTTIFSAWMLENPFYGLFEDGLLRAAGGVTASAEKVGAANLGNFLTDPDRRGRGFAGVVTSTLIHDLTAAGFDHFALATNEENRAAWRCYERIGFRLVERRPQVDLSAP